MLLLNLRIVPVPHRRIMISSGRNHRRSHDRGNVESRPLRHERIKQLLDLEVLVAPFSEFLLNRHSSRVVQRVWIVPVVVRLHQEPLRLAQLVISVNALSIPLNDAPLVRLHARQDIVNRPSDLLVFQSFQSPVIVGLLRQGSPQQPHRRNAVVQHDADQVLVKVFRLSRVHINRKRPMPNARQREHATHHSVDRENFLVALVVLDIRDQVRQQVPHLKVQVPAVEDLPLARPHQNARARLERRILVHEVQEEHFLERVSRQFGDRIDLCHKVLVDEDVLSVPLHPVVERLWNGQLLKLLHELGERNLVVFDDLLPPDLWRVVQRHLVSSGHVRDNRLDSGNDRRGGEQNNAHKKQQSLHLAWRIYNKIKWITKKSVCS